MQHNKLNIEFNQLPLEAVLLNGQDSVKGARQAAMCDKPGIHLPLTDSGQTISLRIGRLIDDRNNVHNFLNLCSINWG